MAACVSRVSRSSRPPIVRAAQSVVPRERVDMELAMQLAALVRAHDADVAVVVDDVGSIVASVGAERQVRALAYFAGAMAHNRAVGTARTFESGRVHVEVTLLSGARHVVAVKGDFFVHDARAIATFVRDAFDRDGVEAEEAIVDGQDDADDDLDFDLDFQSDLRSVVSG
jgi:hypothetical protein